jgi:hypothetical protein
MRLLWVPLQVLNPPRAFKDVDVDECPEQLQDIADAIYDAGAEDLFFKVEASTLSANFKQFSQQSSTGDELVLTNRGFIGLMSSLGVKDSMVLERIFGAWDRNGNGECSGSLVFGL